MIHSSWPGRAGRSLVWPHRGQRRGGQIVLAPADMPDRREWNGITIGKPGEDMQRAKKSKQCSGGYVPDEIATAAQRSTRQLLLDEGYVSLTEPGPSLQHYLSEGSRWC